MSNESAKRLEERHNLTCQESEDVLLSFGDGKRQKFALCKRS